MQDLINHCLQYTPANRPSAQEVFDRLCSTEFVSLTRAVQVEKDQAVQMFATRVSTGMCVWIYSVPTHQIYNENGDVYLCTVYVHSFLSLHPHLGSTRTCVQYII